MDFRKNCLVEIYTSNKSSFSVGVLLCDSDEYSLFNFIDEQGRLDGIYWIRKSYIQSLKYDTKYLNKMSHYMEYWDKTADKYVFSSKLNIEKSLNFEYLLSYIKNSNILSAFKTASDDYIITGYIKDISDEYILVSNIDLETAEEDEEIIVNKKNILLVEIESIDNNLLDYAHKIIGKNL